MTAQLDTRSTVLVMETKTRTKTVISMEIAVFMLARKNPMSEKVLFDKITIGPNGIGWALDDKHQLWITKNAATCSSWELANMPTEDDRRNQISEQTLGKTRRE